MKITNIEAQIKTKGRYSVFVDGKFAYGISELGLINSNLKIGRVLDADELEALKEDARRDRIYVQALDLIMRRPRSEWEIADYLKRKKVDEVVSSETISRLKEKKYINDLDFAKRWVENRRLMKPISKRKLVLELRQKRVDSNIIQQVMEDDEADELGEIRKEIDKKRRQSRYQDDIKLMQYLSRQGYNYSDIKEALAGDR